MSTSLTVIPEESDFEVGQKVEVGGFFWIPKGALIGHDRDAAHGHDCFDGGSVSIGCTLTIRGFEADNAIVRLDRPEMPYGAPAAIGTVFLCSTEMMSRWPDMIAKQSAAQKERDVLAKKYCR